MWNIGSFNAKPNFTPTRVMEVIVSTGVMGDGSKNNPYRVVGIIGTLGGEHLATRDEWAEKHNKPTAKSISVSFKGNGDNL